MGEALGLVVGVATCRHIRSFLVGGGSFFLERGELLGPACRRKGREEVLVGVVGVVVLVWVWWVGIAVVTIEELRSWGLWSSSLRYAVTVA